MFNPKKKKKKKRRRRRRRSYEGISTTTVIAILVNLILSQVITWNWNGPVDILEL